MAELVYQHTQRTIKISDESLKYFDVSSVMSPERYNRLPFSIRILLESAIRNCDNFQVSESDVNCIIDWETNQGKGVEVRFRPARVILQDFTGVPAVVDFAAMRDAVARLGGDPKKINPICPVDLVIDHSVQVDYSGEKNALKKNQELEFERNKERFQFLKWGSDAFDGLEIIPPGSGIVHQVNLEYLARVVFNQNGVMFPDSLVGTDSHTTMINGLGVLGWGVGGIEAEAVMLAQPISMVLPEVIGYKLTGAIGDLATSTDVVLTVTKNLRAIGVVGKFVEFFGPGVSMLSIADRATISNMCPEYGATVGFFPVDEVTLTYLTQTGRDLKTVNMVREYLRVANMLRNYDDASTDPVYTEVHELDLSTVVPSMSGPKRPHDRVSVDRMADDFAECLRSPVGFKGFNIPSDNLDKAVPFQYEGEEYVLRHGSVVISAITSCTNTSNPTVMLGAGLLAKNAVEKGLKVSPYIKTSLSPGSGVVTYYLESSGVIPYLDQLGYGIVGYGCMTCIGNSGPLPEPVAAAIEEGDLVACGVLSGNRNFEGRIHPHTRANYLASPLLVIAYALAGRVNIDFEKEPLSQDADGNDVFLRDIWPSRKDIQIVEEKHVIPEMFSKAYGAIKTGNIAWNGLKVDEGVQYKWDPQSTYIQSPPFFETMKIELPQSFEIKNARVILNLGDSVTTDHISPAGAISRTSPAAKYLQERGLKPRDYNSYGSRRGNDRIMARGTFANIRLMNKFMDKSGPHTLHFPSNEKVSVFDCAMRYKSEGVTAIILAGKDYGAGSSRDWAAKGPWMQGVRAVIAESYERIHRSNLVGMGIIPLQYEDGMTTETAQLTGREMFDIELPRDLSPGCSATLRTDTGKSIQVKVRFDTPVELTYFKHGGILNYMIRNML